MMGDKIKTCASLLALALIILIVFLGMLNLSISNDFSFDNSNLYPSPDHFFGTDNYGRDLLHLTISGLSISLLTGIASSVISTIIALIFAIISASNSKFLSTLIEVFTNACLGIPHIVLMILISFAFGKGAFGVIAAVSLTHWMTLSRILATELSQIKTSNWVKIEKGLGLDKLQLVAKHYVPNISKQLCTGFTLALPHSILHESTLTFLGLGFSPEIPAIGNILSETLKFTLTGNWWLSFFPGISLIVVIIVVFKLTTRINNRLENTI